MGRNHHHHHYHHKRHTCSNCCIGLNTLFFLITLIAGACITGFILVPSLQYQDNWLKLNCSRTGTSMDPSCQTESCKESTNQIQFPYYFYDNGRRFPYEYDAGDDPYDGHSNGTEPENTCPSDVPTQCWTGTLSFAYLSNSSYVQKSNLYVFGTYQNANDFVSYITNDTFHCWMRTSNHSEVSILPIPRYSPGGAIAVGMFL
eukprot:gene2145-2644_t